MSNFGNSCLGGNCVDYDKDYHYAASRVQADVAPQGGTGVSMYFEDIDSPDPSRAMYYNDDPQQQYMSDQAPVAPSANIGALSFTGDGENQCHCEYLMFDNFKWVKQRHYVVAKDGREYFDRYVVTFRKRDSNVEYIFTYMEGAVHIGQIEAKFK